MDIFCASSLKQQSVGGHVAPLGHIIPIPSKLVFLLTPESCVLGGKQHIPIIANLIVFELTPQELEHTIDRIRGEHSKPLHHRCGGFLIEKKKRSVNIYVLIEYLTYF